jgi:hypothetical protein
MPPGLVRRYQSCPEIVKLWQVLNRSDRAGCKVTCEIAVGGAPEPPSSPELRRNLGPALKVTAHHTPVFPDLN